MTQRSHRPQRFFAVARAVAGATRELVLPDPSQWVVILTTCDLDEYVFHAPRAGASGFLLKDVAADELADAVRTVAAGDGILAPRVTGRVLEVFAQVAPPTRPAALDRLTPRELEVLLLLGRGLTNGEIGVRLQSAPPPCVPT